MTDNYTDSLYQASEYAPVRSFLGDFSLTLLFTYDA